MEALVLDTSFLVALFNNNDVFHKKALKRREQIKNEILLLPEYVVLELTTILGIKTSVKISQKATNELLHAKEVRFIPCSEIFASAFKRFHKQDLYKLSFVDCALLEIKESYGASEILTFDKALK